MDCIGFPIAKHLLPHETRSFTKIGIENVKNRVLIAFFDLSISKIVFPFTL